MSPAERAGEGKSSRAGRRSGEARRRMASGKRDITAGSGKT
jgi:hypothetical protein